ncbi:nitroreductase family protein [Actinoplanes sp. NPDC051470]|uniref:nitroreductase family protein n=1 Tax=unclassified Actinoplanes TaxID=2626549 RepID=UPI00341527A0
MTPENISVLEALHSTPARRYLSSDPIPDEIIWELLDAAVRGPSGGNAQPWAWIVVRDPEKKRQIAEYYREGWQKAYGTRREESLNGDAVARRTYLSAEHLAEHLEEAPVWIIPALLVGGRSQNPRLGSSIYGAVQQLMLAARAYGIGATLTTLHSVRDAETCALLGLPEKATTMALVPLGYPAKGRWAEPKRRPLEEVVHWDAYGTNRLRQQ